MLARFRLSSLLGRKLFLKRHTCNVRNTRFLQEPCKLQAS